MTRSRWWAAAVVLAVMVLGNVLFLLVGREPDPAPPARPGPLLSAPPAATSAPAAAPATSAPGPAGAPPGASTRPGDGAPNNGDNNRWKRRHEPSAEEVVAGEHLAARIRPKLEALRAAGDLAAPSIRQAILDVPGVRVDEVIVRELRPPIGATTPPPGAVFGVPFGEVGCLVGDVTPEWVRVEVTGAAAEFGCLEPSSH